MESYEWALIKKCREGDMSSFDQLFALYGDRIYQLAFRYFNNREDANDLTQETFIRIYRGISQYRGEAQFSTWVFRIATNLCYDELRRRKKRMEESLDATLECENGYVTRQIADEVLNPEEEAERKEKMALLQEKITILPQEQKVALILRDIQGFSYQEIADIQGCSIGTVKSRISRARLGLKNLLQEQEELFLCTGSQTR